MAVAQNISSKVLTALAKTTSVGLQPDATVLTKRLLPREGPLTSTTTFNPVSHEKHLVHHSSAVTQPLLVVNTQASTAALQILTTNRYSVRGVNGIVEFRARASPTAEIPLATTVRFLTTTTTGTIILTTTYVSDGVTFTSSTDRLYTSTITTMATIVEFTSSTPTGSTPNNSTTASKTKAIAGGITAAAISIILLVIICVLRHKRRYRAAHSSFSPTLEVPPSSDILVQPMSQSAQSYTRPQPFLDFSLPRNSSPSKGTTPNHASSLLVQNNQVDIAQAVDPFQDPKPAERNMLNSDNEGQRARNTLNHLQALASQFEGEIQQLCILAQSGHLSAEDRLKLDEITRATGLTIQLDPRHGCSSITRSISSGSSSSSAPPSYHTRNT